MSPRGGGSLAPPDYTPVYEGGDVQVNLTADYYSAWRSLKEVDDDSMFERLTYNIPDNVTRQWEIRTCKDGEAKHVLESPVHYVSLSVGYKHESHHDKAHFLGAPDNAEAMRIASHAFTKDLLAAINAAVEKFNGAMAGAASECRAGAHEHLKTSVTIRDMESCSDGRLLRETLRAGPPEGNAWAATRRDNRPKN